MRAAPLSSHGIIGLCSPSHIACREEYRKIIRALKAMGFGVKEADNLYKQTDGYLASAKERAGDFNQLIADEEVELVLFGGGEGSNELLPMIDFELIRRKPKRILSYSDGTTILDSIWAQTGLEVYYGQMPNAFLQLTDYDRRNFSQHILNTLENEHIKASEWIRIREGTAHGILVGGYLRNFAMQLHTVWFPYSCLNQYILFLEDHEKFGSEAYVSAMLTHIEQSGFMEYVKGVLLGHYSAESHPNIYERLGKTAEKYRIPVAYCDDFGHGTNHAIFEIGRACILDTSGSRLIYA